jgi:hypothetical protein
MPLLRIQRPDGGVGWLVRFQQRMSAPLLQMFKHVIVRQLTQPDALKRCVQHRLPTIAAPVAVHTLGKLLAVLLQAARLSELPIRQLCRQFRQAVWDGHIVPHKTVTRTDTCAAAPAEWQPVANPVIGRGEWPDPALHAPDRACWLLSSMSMRSCGYSIHEPRYQWHDKPLAVSHGAGHAQHAPSVRWSDRQQRAVPLHDRPANVGNVAERSGLLRSAQLAACCDKAGASVNALQVVRSVD